MSDASSTGNQEQEDVPIASKLDGLDGSDASSTGKRENVDVPNASELDGFEGLDWVEKAAELVLKSGNATREHPKTGAEIFDAVSKLGVNVPVAKNTFSSYLSAAVKRVECPFTSTGRGRGGGYFLSETSRALAEEASTPAPQASAEERSKEKWLYRALLLWMLGRDYRAKDTSSLRSRDLGKWGNPDVTGIAVYEHLTRLEIEVATIEAKVGFDAWESDFFQAVSQRRFANRAYFAFALPHEAAEKLPSELRYYSELFSVGVLVVELEDGLYGRLTTGTLNDNDKEYLNNPEDDPVREVLSAPLHHVPASYQRRFCEALSIRDIRDLMQWGLETT